MLNILVIDDDKNMRNLISIYLTTAGYDVVTAKDGEEGIRRFDESSFNAVITDLIMPYCNGNDVARYVRNAGRNIPVIGITGTPWEMDNSSFDIVLNKPFSGKKLVEYIKEIENTGETIQTS
jgi:DNA-binding response OmpR family regulator